MVKKRGLAVLLYCQACDKIIWCMILSFCIMLSVVGCSGEGERLQDPAAEEQIQAETLSVYLLENTTFLEDAIDDFNKQQGRTAIEYTLFSFEEDYGDSMYQRMISEVMAGEGPDLFHFYGSESRMNVWQMMEQGAFVDMGEVGVPLPYGDISMEQAMLLPISYTVPLLFTTADICEQYGIDREKSVLTMEDLKKLSENGLPVVPQPTDSLLTVFYEDYLDHDKKTSDFSSEEFRDILRDMQSWNTYDIDLNVSYGGSLRPEEYEALKNGELLFSVQDAITPIGVIGLYDRLLKETGKELEIFAVREDESHSVRAWAQDIIAFNANTVEGNSGKKAIAAAFVKYLLSEEIQMFSEQRGTYRLSGLPVLKESRDELIDMMVTIPFQKFYTLDMEVGLSEHLKEKYKEIQGEIKEYMIQDGTYQYGIFREAVEDYRNGLTVIETFTENLDRKTQLYLNE